MGSSNVLRAIVGAYVPSCGGADAEYIKSVCVTCSTHLQLMAHHAPQRKYASIQHRATVGATR
jgi:hypothetical protein